MSISDAQFAEWLLRDDRRACTLVELDRVVETAGAPVVEATRMSNRPFAGPTGPYDDCVKAVPTYNRSLAGASLNSYQVSFGTLKLDNSDGALDWLLGAAADGSEVRFLYGDEAWPYADFRLIFACMVQKIEASALGELTVSLKDTSLLLNKSIGGDIKIGGDGPNADRWRPVVFGYIHQAECIAWDDATLSYVFAESGDGIVDISGTFSQTVRDGGDPIDVMDNGDGSFSMTSPPVFQITTDILCAPDGNAAHRCVSDALDHFIGTRGGLTPLGKYTGPGDTYSARPASGVEAWVDAGGEDYLIGVYVPERRNLIDLVNEITDTGNCFWACDRLGSIFLGRLRPFDTSVLGATPRRAIVEDDIDIGTLRITHALPTYYRLQCRAARNWTIITQVADVLTPEERDYLTRKGLEKIQDSFVGAGYDANPQLYHLSMAESPTIDTLLSSGNGEDAIEIGRMDLWMGVRRGMTLPWIETVTLRTGLDRYDHELGDLVPIDFTATERTIFDPARTAQVIGIDIDLTEAKITLRLQLRRKPDVPVVEDPPTIPVEAPTPPGLRSSAMQMCSLNPMPCILTNGPPMFCPLEINCGVPDVDPCGTGWGTFSYLYGTPMFTDFNQFVNLAGDYTWIPQDMTAANPRNFPNYGEMRHTIIPGVGMDLGTTNPADVTWVVTDNAAASDYTMTVTPVSSTWADGWYAQIAYTDPFNELRAYTGLTITLQAQIAAADVCLPVTYLEYDTQANAAPPACGAGFAWILGADGNYSPDTNMTMAFNQGNDMVLPSSDPSDYTWDIQLIAGSGTFTPAVTARGASVGEGWDFTTVPELDGSYAGTQFQITMMYAATPYCSSLIATAA